MITLTPPWQHRRPGRRAFPKPTARRILQRDPTCQLHYPGCTTTSTIADHITGWADATAAGWTQDQIDDETNGQGVCHSCHNIKTQHEAATGRARTAPQRSRRRPAERHPGLR